MALTAGKKLGPYEILAPLGAGGMGEVYRCRDTRLGRDVAIKVLPQHLSTNPDVRARFEREAKSISSLNHPNICTLYDIGREGDTDYLVMELVEGETLAHRIAKGALPLDQTLKIGIEVADALARAHRAGIVHRDLKPSNVMLTKSGAKLMDFGLARAIMSEHPSSSSGVTMTAPHSPSADRPLTAEGTIVGTFMYMSPEQLEGKDADARSDLWALGCVIYEMVTGKKAFEGKSQASLIGAIMNSEPRAMSELAPLTPPALQHTVKSCLAKDPEERIQTARDVMLELRWIAEGGSQAGVAAPVAARRKTRERAAWILAALMTLAAAGLAVGQWTMRPPSPQVLRFEIPPPHSVRAQDSPRISPDGLYLAYTATDSTGAYRIWVRPLSGLSAQALAGTEGANRPFWSPDSRFLGFVADGKLKKIPVGGGPTTVICDAETGADGSWSKKGVILFDGNIATDPIRQVSAMGGVATDVARVDSTTQVGWPEFLPDGRHFLYLANQAPSTLCVGDLRSKEVRTLGPCESQVQFVKSGYLLFSRSGSLVLQRFDPRTLKLAGETIPIAEQVTSSVNGASDFRTSDNGILVYSTRRAQVGELVEINREGRRLRTLPCPPTSMNPALSPDERRIAVRAFDDRSKTRDLWLVELDREMMTRLTFDPTHETQPLWSPDGKRIAFWSDRPGSAGVYVKQLTGSGQEELLHLLPDEPSLTHWSRDGSRMIYTVAGGPQRFDIWLLETSGEKKTRPFLNGPFNERDGQLSPNGEFLAYSSDESGQYQIYVQRFPDRSEKWQISTRGGTDPQWRSDGKELFFLGGDQTMMSAKINSSETQFSAELPQLLFPLVVHVPSGPRNHYVVTADGNRFYVIVPKGSDAPPSTTVVVNWMKQISSS